MNITQSIRNRFKENLKHPALITQDQVYTYKDILDSWDSWYKKINSKNITSKSTVMVRGDYGIESLGLMFSLFEQGATYIPIVNTQRNIEHLQKIAQATDYFDLSNESYKKLNNIPSHSLFKKLQYDPGLILFSSGTTGHPKAILTNVQNLLQTWIHKKKCKKTIVFLLFDHMGGFHTIMRIILNTGTVVVPRERSANTILSTIQKYNVEVLPASPALITMFLLSGCLNQYNLDSLKTITYGTEPMPETILKRFNKMFPHIQLKQTYGLTELGVLKTKSMSSDSLFMKIKNDDTCQSKIQNGTLWIKTQTSMLGYLNAPQPFDKDGWMNTQDAVEQHGEYIKIIGRTSNLINVGGQKVYPSEVENVIMQTPNVQEVLVKSEKNPLLGQIPVAFILCNNKSSQEKVKKNIKDICKKNLEKYKRPVKIVFKQSSLYNDRFKKVLRGE